MKRTLEILDPQNWDTRPGSTVFYLGLRCGLINRRQIGADGQVKVEVIFDETPGGRDIYERSEIWK